MFGRAIFQKNTYVFPLKATSPKKLALFPDQEKNLCIRWRVVSMRRSDLHRMNARQRNGYGDVDTDLSNFDLALKFAGCGSRLSKDRGTISIFIGIDDIKRIVKCVSSDHNKDGAKYFFPGRKRK